MKATSQQKIRIGTLVLAGLFVLIAAIFLIGNKRGLFTNTFRVHGLFSNVNGLQVGNNVRFAGINVGVVEDIHILNDSTVKVGLTLNEDVRKFIKKDASLSISSDGLMGDKLLVISPGGVTNNAEVRDGDQLSGVSPLDMDRVIKKLTRIADNADTVVYGLASIVTKINSGHGTIGRLLNDDKVANDLEGTVKQARSTIATVHSTSSTLNEDLEAAQHNFFLKGFFKKKKKLEKARQDSIKKAQHQMAPDSAGKAPNKKGHQ
jgi:phospholipid/cholesterol/gamma-HCH transport system substrate-binding protein